MNVESAVFEMLAEPPIPDWILRVTAKGSGFLIRTMPVEARIGDVPFEALFEDDDGQGFLGYLTTVPPDGAHLFVGYAGRELIDTGIEFQAPPIV